jgi:hypothetical protein
VTMIDIQSWVNIHVYLVKDFNRIWILFNFERLVGDGTTLVASSPMWNFLVISRGLIVEVINFKLICFGFDGIVIFWRSIMVWQHKSTKDKLFSCLLSIVLCFELTLLSKHYIYITLGAINWRPLTYHICLFFLFTQKTLWIVQVCIVVGNKREQTTSQCKS